MASLIYNSALDDIAKGKINLANDRIAVILVTDGYKPNREADTRRSHVTNEVSGAGYSSGGKVVTVKVIKDNDNDRVNVLFGNVSWPKSTITARFAVYYKKRSGSEKFNDEIIACVDFGQDVTSTRGEFLLSESTIRLQNGS